LIPQANQATVHEPSHQIGALTVRRRLSCVLWSLCIAHLGVGGEDFYLDLFFYHVRLYCYIVIDLKMGDFQPEFAGKMNFYLAAVDDIVRQAEDQPSIGIILCKKQNKVVAEYALKDIHSPMGIATYQLTELLPDILKGSLPEIKDLKSTLFEQEEPHHTKE
jgi:YhcG PDDEXK nuclease domain